MPQTQTSLNAAAREPVIVELFTSEGCSSCPPADALLAELATRQPLGSAEVIALEEHVDYWDEQGWHDPFSSATWTARQYEYAGKLHNGNPYTPEMVVDGVAGFVGSRGVMARQEIAKAAAIKKASSGSRRSRLETRRKLFWRSPRAGCIPRQRPGRIQAKNCTIRLWFGN